MSTPGGVLLLATLLMPQADAVKATSGKLVVTGQGTGFMKWSSLDAVFSSDGKPAVKSVDLTLTLFELEGGKKLVVALPPARAMNDQQKTGVDPDLQRLLAQMDEKKLISVEGAVATATDSLVTAFAGASGAKSVPMLVAAKETKVDDANRKQFPEVNHGWVEGVLIKRDVGGLTYWAVRVGEGSVRLMIQPGAALPPAGNRVRAAGKVIFVDGQLALTASELRATK